MERVDGRGGEPLWKQKMKVRRARKRNTYMRARRCAKGLHNPPFNQTFQDEGAVYIGGKCTECAHEGRWVVVWIGNAWDFPGGVSKEITKRGIIYHIDSVALQEAVAEHMHMIGSLP